jgi:hypothetical protein
LEPPPEIASTLRSVPRANAVVRARASSASARSSDQTRAFGMSGMTAAACCSFVNGTRGTDAQPATASSASATTAHFRSVAHGVMELSVGASAAAKFHMF